MPKKQPYMPVYMGDDVRECGHLSPEEYGGYCRLRFALWDREDRGRMVYDMKAFMRLMGTDTLHHTEQIVSKLIQERILEREPETGEAKYLVRRRMVEEFELSKTRSKTGSKGGKTTQQKRKQNNNNAIDFAKAKTEAKTHQNPENESEYEDDIESKGVGGTGEEDNIGYAIPTPPIAVMECVELYKSPAYEMIRNTISHSAGITPNQLLEWVDVFGAWLLTGGGEEEDVRDGRIRMTRFVSFFRNWFLKRNDKQNPQNYFKNATNSSKYPAPSGGTTGGKGGSLEELLALRAEP